jgi:hypothetical protein
MASRVLTTHLGSCWYAGSILPLCTESFWSSRLRRNGSRHRTCTVPPYRASHGTLTRWRWVLPAAESIHTHRIYHHRLGGQSLCLWSLFVNTNNFAVIRNCECNRRVRRYPRDLSPTKFNTFNACHRLTVITSIESVLFEIASKVWKVSEPKKWGLLKLHLEQTCEASAMCRLVNSVAAVFHWM